MTKFNNSFITIFYVSEPKDIDKTIIFVTKLLKNLFNL